MHTTILCNQVLMPIKHEYFPKKDNGSLSNTYWIGICSDKLRHSSEMSFKVYWVFLVFWNSETWGRGGGGNMLVMPWNTFKQVKAGQFMAYMLILHDSVTTNTKVQEGNKYRRIPTLLKTKKEVLSSSNSSPSFASSRVIHLK